MIFNVIQDNAYPPPHLFYQAACKREPLSTRLVTRTPTHKWLAFRTHCVDPRIHGKRNERYEATVYIYPARNQQLDSVEIFVACPTWAITRIRPSFITTCSSILADLTVSLVEEEDTRVEPSRFCDGLFSRVMTHVHALFQPLIFRPFSQVSLPLPSLVTVSLSFLFLSFFSFHLSLSPSFLSILPCSLSERIEGSTTTTTRTRLCKPSHSPAAMYIPIYNCCSPTYEGDSGLARDSRGFLHVPILLLLHRRTADPSSLVSGQIPSSKGEKKKRKKKTSMPWKVNETAVAWTNSLDEIDNELFRLETRYYLYNPLFPSLFNFSWPVSNLTRNHHP